MSALLNASRSALVASHATHRLTLLSIKPHVISNSLLSAQWRSVTSTPQRDHSRDQNKAADNWVAVGADGSHPDYTGPPSIKKVSPVQAPHAFEHHPHDAVGSQSNPPLNPTKEPMVTMAKMYGDWVMSHPVYTQEEMASVDLVRHERKTMGDKAASGAVRFARWAFDTITRYKHANPDAAREALVKSGKANMSLAEKRAQGFVMTPDQWLSRVLFLESIAGVPGMVGGMLRHLRSLRLMKRDGGWINMLLQEAENERMHLMTFMKIKNPSVIFRGMVLLTQGVFFNLFFLAYMMSPKIAHRFVGCLEEEACITYTYVIEEMKRGNLPEWEKAKIPDIACDYWRLPKDAPFVDLLLAVRADEAGHRFINHTLSNLDQHNDINPFGVKHADAKLQGQHPGLQRQESIAWTQGVEAEMAEAAQKVDKLAGKSGQMKEIVEEAVEEAVSLPLSSGKIASNLS